jgi:hypothetical protein
MSNLSYLIACGAVAGKRNNRRPGAAVAYFRMMG